MQGARGSGAGANGGKVGLRSVGGSSGWRGGRECLVESLANHSQCVRVACGDNPLIIHGSNHPTDMMALPGA